MGTYIHNALMVMVHHDEGGKIEQAVNQFRDSLPDNWKPLVIGPISTVVNGHKTYYFAPDGSKEWWDTSDEGNEYRKRFAELFTDVWSGGDITVIAVVMAGSDTTIASALLKRGAPYDGTFPGKLVERAGDE